MAVGFVALSWRTYDSIPSIGTTTIVYSAPMDYGILAACKPAVREMLRDLDDRERVILNRRVLATGKKLTLQELADQYSITRERARQVEELVVARLKKRALRSLNKSLTRAVKHLEHAIGAVCPKEYVFSEGITKDDQGGSEIPAELVLRLILWLAGPYEEYCGWLVRDPATGFIEMTKKIVRRMARREPASLEAVMTSVARIGIHREWCLRWVSTIEDIRIFGDRVVLWNGSLSDKAFAILKISGKPLSIDNICREIGGEFSRRTVLNYLHAHHAQFRKSGPDLFSLAEWGGQEYTSVKDFVLRQIDLHRGTAKKDLLIRKAWSDLGVPKSTVVAVLASPIFIHSSSGYIRLRNQDDPVPKAQDIGITKHCYRLRMGVGTTYEHGVWSYRLKVTRETLRGSGTNITPVFGLHLGMKPGKQFCIASPSGTISLSWTMPQPTIGSLQKAARSLSADIGDRLFLIAVGTKKLQFSLIRSADVEKKQGWERLCLEVCGSVFATEQECVRSIAFALGLDGVVDGSAQKIRRRLEIRRERELIGLIPKDDLVAGTEELDTLIDYVSRA